MKKGAVAIVTGGSRGLGLLLAERLGRRGACVVLVARDSMELVEAKKRLKKIACPVQVLSEDLEDPAAAARIVDAVLARFGRIDILVNDAGIIQVGPQKSMGMEDYYRGMEANFWSAVRLTRAAMRELEKSRGAILNITSIGGAVPVPHLLPYVASKFAFVGWSAGLAAEAAKDGVRVTTVLPWLMRTGSFLHALVKGQQDKESANFALSSSLPFLTMSAPRAADRMMLALERGERWVTVGTQAKLLRLGFALAPSTAIRALALVNRLLPKPGGAGPRTAAEPLWMHRRGISRSFLTWLGDLAAERNNETIRVPS